MFSNYQKRKIAIRSKSIWMETFQFQSDIDSWFSSNDNFSVVYFFNFFINKFYFNTSIQIFRIYNENVIFVEE